MTEPLSKTKHSDWRRTMIVPVVVALVIVVIAGFLIDRQNQQIAETRLRAQTFADLSVIRAKLEGNISGNVQLVKGLVSVIATEPDMDQARYGELVQNLIVEDSQLRSVAAAPDLVISMTYPLEANRAAIGVDYRNVPAQWDAVRRVVETGELTIAGPVDLVQGGRGFVGRFPVYTLEDGERRFWGVIAAVIDLERLYADSGLYDTELEISITGQDGTGASGTLFTAPTSAAPIRLRRASCCRRAAGCCPLPPRTAGPRTRSRLGPCEHCCLPPAP
nr:CHASE domain-containing protein [Devosia aurantiaca]